MILAQSSKEQGNLPNALNYLKKILKLDSNNKRALNNAGNTCKEMQKFDEAISYYTKAINIDQGYIIAKINLAILHHDLGNLDKAEDLYKKMILLDKYNFAIYFNLSRINFEYFDEDKIGFIKNSINNENISDYNKASAYFILAKHEQMKKNFDKEIKFLDKGHRYLRKSFRPKVYEQSLNYWLKIIPKKFDKIEISNLEKIEKKDIEINPIFIIGMPRSGTSLLEQILSSHSKIYGAGELNYLQKIIDKIGLEIPSDPSKYFLEIRKYYSDEIHKISNSHFIIDKLPSNFRWVGFILKSFPEAKIIHIKRNPMAVCWSNYKNFFIDTGLDFNLTQKDVSIYYSMYSNLMDFWSLRFKNHIFDIQYENFVKNFEADTRKILNYLNLQWEDQLLQYQKTNRPVTTASHQQVREKIKKNTSEEWKKYKNYLKPMQEVLKNMKIQY